MFSPAKADRLQIMEPNCLFCHVCQLPAWRHHWFSSIEMPSLSFAFWKGVMSSLRCCCFACTETCPWLCYSAHPNLVVLNQEKKKQLFPPGVMLYCQHFCTFADFFWYLCIAVNMKENFFLFLFCFSLLDDIFTRLLPVLIVKTIKTIC